MDDTSASVSLYSLAKVSKSALDSSKFAAISSPSGTFSMSLIA